MHVDTKSRLSKWRTSLFECINPHERILVHFRRVICVFQARNISENLRSERMIIFISSASSLFQSGFICDHRTGRGDYRTPSDPPVMTPPVMAFLLLRKYVWRLFLMSPSSRSIGKYVDLFIEAINSRMRFVEGKGLYAREATRERTKVEDLVAEERNSKWYAWWQE